MLKISDGKIGAREFIAIIVISFGIKAKDTTPDLLIFPGKNAAWIMPAFAYVIFAIPLLLLLSLLKKHNQGLMELVYSLAGKWFGMIIGIALFAMTFSSTVLDSRSYIDIVVGMYYPQTPVPFLLIFLMAVSFFVAKRGFEVIGRTSWMFFWFVHFMALFITFLVWRETDWLRLFPIAGPGLKDLAVHSAEYSSIFGGIIVIAVFYPFVRNYQDYRLASWLGFSISAVWLVWFIALYTVIFDYPAVEYLNFPYHQLARLASIGTNSHLESVFFASWIISSVLHFAVLLYSTAILFAKTVRIDEFEPLILPFTGLVVLTGLTIENIVILNEYREILLKLSSYSLFSLPFVLWVLDRWKGRAR